MRITRCDNCKKVRPESFGKQVGWANISYTGNPAFVTLDLCTDCSKKLLHIPRKFLQGQEKKK
ncbi:MAG: hypothetical protein A2991_02450 [Candidatus Terrybacteria bacterium RIFCSPLOWO2_01_FULL_58_14]|uniref:Uncharacterized protein n=1 Tax=Candidatus Terrybacteria bacterium RIFCSPLOWO2_01_FULL_58_14 TaxID=1802369 RepID=A0A1G2PY76_9BACT|nr:MAG: hypothetical protein A2991_02450 [Candidatus Terrybacteria bacterium RIFCSPLOWO2_01_FULL_58_14]